MYIPGCVKDFVDDECHTKIFRAEAVIYKIESIKKKDVELLCYRISTLEDTENKCICDYHCKKCISFDTSNEKKCSDPWDEHEKTIDKELSVVDLNFSEKVNQHYTRKKMNRNCKKKFFKIVENYGDSLKYCIDPFERHGKKVESSLMCLNSESKDFSLEVYNIDISLDEKICKVCSDSLDSEILNHKQLLENETKCLPKIKVNTTNSSDASTPTGNI